MSKIWRQLLSLVSSQILLQCSIYEYPRISVRSGHKKRVSVPENEMSHERITADVFPDFFVSNKSHCHINLLGTKKRTGLNWLVNWLLGPPEANKPSTGAVRRVDDIRCAGGDCVPRDVFIHIRLDTPFSWRQANGDFECWRHKSIGCLSLEYLTGQCELEFSKVAAAMLCKTKPLNKLMQAELVPPASRITMGYWAVVFILELRCLNGHVN